MACRTRRAESVAEIQRIDVTTEPVPQVSYQVPDEAPLVGIEATTLRLRGACSTLEFLSVVAFAL